MVRIKGKMNDTFAHEIDKQSVAKFFRERAAKISELGHVQAVIYQDKNPELAQCRDEAEKTKLLPLLKLQGSEAVLDVGCGTGRWADVVVPKCRQYVGTDFSKELIDIAVSRFASSAHVDFRCVPAELISNEILNEKFQVILSLGLFIYLNDDELAQAVKGYALLSDVSCRILIREPVGTDSKLTIKEHYSDDMDQEYNAIYRTEQELMKLFEAYLFSNGFKMSGHGDVYDNSLNNRMDTKQKWFLLER